MNEEFVQIILKLKRSLVDRIDKKAAREYTTRTQIIREAILKALGGEEK